MQFTHTSEHTLCGPDLSPASLMPLATQMSLMHYRKPAKQARSRPAVQRPDRHAWSKTLLWYTPQYAAVQRRFARPQPHCQRRMQSTPTSPRQQSRSPEHGLPPPSRSPHRHMHASTLPSWPGMPCAGMDAPRTTRPHGLPAAKCTESQPMALTFRAGGGRGLDATVIRSRPLQLCPERARSGSSAQEWMGLSYVAIAASLTASDRVGWPWQDRAMSSVDAPYSIACRGVHPLRRKMCRTHSWATQTI